MNKKTRKHPILTNEALELVSARFRALSDPKRLRILNLLMQGESSVQDLADAAGLEQPSVSRNLSQLRREGIVARRSEGNRAIYRIHDPTVIDLCESVCGGLAEHFSEGLDALGDQAIRKPASRNQKTSRLRR
jgi:DNA-binding transcriptional ArsR family regulator